VTIQLLTGDCRDVLATLPACSVHTVVTSPPYYGLRDYGVTGQLGLEATPEAYLAAMVEVFRAIRRVLRDDGTCWVNQGDLFINKQLQMMPSRFALALQADGWFIRSSIIWHKPNPMPESCTDRPTSAHEHVFLLSKRARYFYDSDAVREPLAAKTFTTFGCEHRPQGNDAGGNVKSDNWGSSLAVRKPKLNGAGEIAGANMRNVWTLATEAFPGVHYATFPTALVERCIRAGTSERGCCAVCGAPWVREPRPGLDLGDYFGGDHTMAAVAGMSMPAPNKLNGRRTAAARAAQPPTTIGWRASCQCSADVVPATVLDPFVGSGTTALVADRMQRHAIGIDLNTTYADMARTRVTDDCPLFTSWAPAETDAEDERMRDLFSAAAD
jgi:DNA modification methylase